MKVTDVATTNPRSFHAAARRVSQNLCTNIRLYRFKNSIYYAVQRNEVVREPNDLNGCRNYSRRPAEN